MKEEVWTFLLENQNGFEEVSSEDVSRLFEEKNAKVFPGLGGKLLHLAIVRMSHDNGELKKVRGIELRRCKLTKNGSLDSKFKEKRKKLTAELDAIEQSTHRSPKVVDATLRFKERRFKNEFTWTPTVTMVQKLSSMIQEKSKGVLVTREIMYQILHLTATA